MFKHFDKVTLIQPIKLFELYQQEFQFVHSSLRHSRSKEACLVFPLAYFSCFSCFFRALQKNRALWRLLYLFIMISNFLTKKNHELKLWSFTMLSCLQAWGLKTRQQCKRTVFFSVWWRKLQSFTASRKHGTVSKFPFYFRLVHLLSFFEGRSVEKGGHMISIFFLEGTVTNPAIWLAL